MIAVASAFPSRPARMAHILSVRDRATKPDGFPYRRRAVSQTGLHRAACTRKQAVGCGKVERAVTDPAEASSVNCPADSGRAWLVRRTSTYSLLGLFNRVRYGRRHWASSSGVRA